MSGLVIILFLYGIGITIALIVANNTRDKYIRKYMDLEKRYQQLQKYYQNTAAVPPQAPAEAPLAAPVPAPVPSTAPVAAPAAAPVPAPAARRQSANQMQLPTYTKAGNEPRKNGLGAVGVSFAVGVLLMVIAAAVFISATWQTMPAGIKCVILAAVVAVVYGFSFFCRKKLKLEKTSSVLYMLGSLITPLAITVGFLAFESKETVLMLGCCALSLGVAGFIGYKIFGSKLQVAVSYIGFVWVDIFICMKALGNYEGFVVGLCSAALISGIIYYVQPKLKFFNLFAEYTAYAAAVAFFMTGGLGKDRMWCALTAQVLFWVSYLLLNRKRPVIKYFSAAIPVYAVFMALAKRYVDSDTGFGIICIVSAVVLFAVYKMIKQENPGSNMIISIGLSGACLALYISNLLDGEVHNALHYISLILPVAIFLYVLIACKTKWERAMYTYFQFLSVAILAEDLFDGYIPFYIFLGVAVVSFFIAFKFRFIHLPIASAVASIVIYFVHSEKLWENDIHIIIFAAVSALLYGGIVLVRRKFDLAKTAEAKPAWIAVRFSSLAMLIISNVMLMSKGISAVNASFIALLIIDIALFAITLLDEDNYFGPLPSATFMIAVVSTLIRNGVDRMAVGAIFVVAFVIIGRLLVCERIISKKRIDWLTFLAGIACFIPLEKPYMSTFLMSLYAMTFLGRFSDADSVEEKVKSNLRVVLSVAVGLLFISFAIADIDYTSTMDFEIRLLLILAAAFIIRFVINAAPCTRWIWFSTVAFCIELEACRAMADGKLLPLTFVSVCVCGIFIYSFIAKRRSWFILAISNIAIIGVMFAVTFWESKLWWMYLLVLGGILIGTASLNEYKRRRAIESGLEDKKIRLFDSWTW